MATYAQKLLHPKWQKKRLEILTRDNFACFWCGDTETTLHVHHEMYNGSNPWDTPNECLTTLCADCHKVDSLKNLTSLEKYLIEAFRFREKHNTDMIKLFNKIVLREKTSL